MLKAILTTTALAIAIQARPILDAGTTSATPVKALIDESEPATPADLDWSSETGKNEEFSVTDLITLEEQLELELEENPEQAEEKFDGKSIHTLHSF